MAGERDIPGPDEWQCLIFIAIAEQHSISGAARALTESRGSVCQRRTVEKAKQRIEDWYGGEPLFLRQGNRLLLTDKGQIVLEAMRNVVTEYRLLRTSATDADAPPLVACHPHHARFVTRAAALLRERGSGRDRARDSP